MAKLPMQQINVGNNVSLFDHIEQAIALIGKCNLDVCTFSISDDGNRFLSYLSQNKKVVKTRIILDSSAMNNKKEAVLSTAKLAEVRFAPNHSKIILLRGTLGNGYIITSSNFNITKRNELVMLGFEEDIFLQLSTFFENLWLDGISQ